MQHLFPALLLALSLCTSGRAQGKRSEKKRGYLTAYKLALLFDLYAVEENE